jgi:hypothetical protein
MKTQKTLDLGACVDVPHLWKGILDSYHNFYDIFSELIQNSVDSVRKAERTKPKINISYDNTTQTIEVKDNGIGLSEDDLKYFALGNTNKADDDQTIGEKGLGASFILGISDTFYLETVRDNKKIVATCKNAFDTIQSRSVPELSYSVQDVDEPSYCIVRVQISKVDISIESLAIFKYILRTKTAVGNTKNLFLAPEERETIEILVNYSDGKGIQNETIPFLYLHLDELVDGYFPVFDAEFSRKNNKWMIDESDINSKPRGVLRIVDYEKRIYLTFAEASIYERFGENIGESRFPEDIVVAIKGCPTSVEVNKPRLGNAGYYTNLHVVIEGDGFTLDAGRKTITRENANEVRDKIKSFFSDIVKFSKFFLGTTHDAIGEGAGLDEIKQRARETEDLHIEKITFGKVPRHEQSVVAIFHEMIGANVINGYTTLLVSQYNTFDILFEYTTPIDNIGRNPRDIYKKSAGKTVKNFRHLSFGEFKLDLSNFCNDVNNDTKRLDHVNLVICWEAAGKIPPGWKFRKIYDDEKIYDGANYVLEKTGHKTVHVMLLKDFNTSE